MKKQIIEKIMNENLKVIVRTDIAVGRGINGIDYRDFNSEDYGIHCYSEHMEFYKGGQVFAVEYKHIVAIEGYYVKYDYRCGGIE